MKLKPLATAGLIACATLATPAAHADFVIGSASLTGFFQNNTTALGVPITIVSALTAFDVSSSALVGSTSGDLEPDGTGTAFDFTFLTAPRQVFTFNGFTFTVQDWGPVNATPMLCGDDQCSDGIGFSGTGSVTSPNFQATAFTMSWSAQGSCNNNEASPGQCDSNATASWSASISATGEEAVTQVPEPASLALVGLALAGMGFMRRRRA